MKKLLIVAVGIFLITSSLSWADHPADAPKDVQSFPGAHEAVWYVVGMKPHLIGGYGDNFNYSGDKVTPLTGEATVFVDAEQDTGIMIVTVQGTIQPEKDKTYTGEIMLVYKVLPKPKAPAFQEGGVADFIYLHGDSKQGPPVMPKVRTFLGAWALADLYVDGKLVYKDLDGHMMFTERSRDPETQAIYADASKTTIYSPKTPGKGYVIDPEGRELHFVAHSMEEDPDNFPPNTVWIHLNFEEAKEAQ